MATKSIAFGKISASLVKTMKQLQSDQATTVIVIFEEQFTQAQKARLVEPEKPLRLGFDTQATQPGATSFRAISRNEKIELFRASSIKAQEASLEFLTKKGKDYFTSVKNVDFDESKVKQLESLNAILIPATSKLNERRNHLGIKMASD